MSSILCFDFLAIRHVRPHSLHWKAKASLLDSSGKSQALDFKKGKTRSLYVSVCFSSTVMHRPVERSDYLFCKGGVKAVGFPRGSVGKNPPARAGDTGSIPGPERAPGEENGNPPQYSCLGHPMNRGIWLVPGVHGVAEELDMA